MMMTLSILLKATIVLVAALAGSWLARSHRAAVRHVLLASAFVALLILPAAALVVPVVAVEVPAALYNSIVIMSLEPPADAFVPDSTTAIPAATGSMTAPRAQIQPAWAWPSGGTLLLGVWITGAAMFLLPVVVGLGR
jgi:hypothetical protein